MVGHDDDVGKENGMNVVKKRTTKSPTLDRHKLCVAPVKCGSSALVTPP